MTIQDKIKVFRLATQTIYMLLVGSIAINLLIQKAPIVILDVGGNLCFHYGCQGRLHGQSD